ncbi:hypothetical protein DFS33DRAFT_1272471 [Desarmillaria ectypa]|nr:hypothetical protein DFS33DRAFT_1272471 [Desarmillaria ectypa]
MGLFIKYLYPAALIQDSRFIAFGSISGALFPVSCTIMAEQEDHKNIMVDMFRNIRLQFNELKAYIDNQCNSFQANPIPNDLNIDHCAEFREGEFWNGEQSATVSFDLPLNSGKPFLLVHRSYINRWVYIGQSEDVSLDTVKVEVTVKYRDDELELAKVCKVSRAGNENGIGFFTPRHAHRNHIHPGFDVCVLLPKAPLTIQDFRTDLPPFSHHVGVLETIFFESITLHSAVMPIYVESVSTAVGKFKNVNIPIEGKFNTSTSLDLVTANSPINVIVGLFNADERQCVFIDASVDSALDLTAHTAMGSVDVIMHPTYEGEFRLATVMGRAEVTTHDDAEDQKGEDRKKSIVITLCPEEEKMQAIVESYSAFRVTLPATPPQNLLEAVQQWVAEINAVYPPTAADLVDEDFP